MMKLTQLTKKQKVISIVIVGVLILLLFGLWWYGFFPEIGKSDDITKIMEVDFVTETTEERTAYCKKEASRLSTETLLYEVLRTHPSANPPYDTPEIAANYEAVWGDDCTAGAAYKELLSRASTGRKLLNLYEDYTVIEDFDVYRDLAKIELLLAQPEVRRHLTPFDLSRLESAITQVQRAKYTSGLMYENTIGLSYERRNYLFTDAYTASGWDYDKLNEIAVQYDGEFIN